MKPVTVVLSLAGLLLLSGGVVWLLDGTARLPALSAWLWLAAFAVLCIPLLVLGIVRLFEVLRGR
jgi:hypothetical protein